MGHFFESVSQGCLLGSKDSEYMKLVLIHPVQGSVAYEEASKRSPSQNPVRTGIASACFATPYATEFAHVCFTLSKKV